MFGRNFARINNYHNRAEAWKDWTSMADTAVRLGHPDLADQHKPAEDAGWRKIDKATAALRRALEEATCE